MLDTPSYIHDDPPLVAQPEFCQWLQISPKTAESWRAAGKGPPFIRLPGSRLIRYRRADIEAWLVGNNGETGRG